MMFKIKTNRHQGDFYFVAQHSGLVLDVEGGINPGAKIIQWNKKAPHEAGNQKFHFTEDGFIALGANPNLVLDIEGNGDKGTKVILWHKKPHHQASNQRWKWTKSGQIVNRGNPRLALDIEGGSKKGGAKLIVWERKPHHEAGNQKFQLERFFMGGHTAPSLHKNDAHGCHSGGGSRSAHTQKVFSFSTAMPAFTPMTPAYGAPSSHMVPPTTGMSSPVIYGIPPAGAAPYGVPPSPYGAPAPSPYGAPAASPYNPYGASAPPPMTYSPQPSYTPNFTSAYPSPPPSHHAGYPGAYPPASAPAAPYSQPPTSYQPNVAPHGGKSISGYGFYSIVSARNGKALDSNISTAPNVGGLPRTFLWNYEPHSHNHQWQMQQVEGEWFMIVSKTNGMALDGNNDPQIAQQSFHHPSPFLYSPNKGHNQQWRFQHLQGDTYMIVNRRNGKALDGNFEGAPQYDPHHPAPFLWDPNASSANHHWIFYHHQN